MAIKPTHTDTIVDAEPGTVAEEAICGAVHIAESGLVVLRPYGKMIAFANGKKVQRIFKDEPAGSWVKRKVNQFAAFVLSETKPKRTRKKKEAK